MNNRRRFANASLSPFPINYSKNLASDGSAEDVPRLDPNFVPPCIKLQPPQIAAESGSIPNAVQFQRDLTVSFNKLGDLELAEGNVQKAREYYQSALEITRKLADVVSQDE